MAELISSKSWRKKYKSNGYIIDFMDPEKTLGNGMKKTIVIKPERKIDELFWPAIQFYPDDPESLENANLSFTRRGFSFHQIDKVMEGLENLKMAIDTALELNKTVWD